MNFILLLLTLAGLLSGLLYLMQSSMIFYPYPALVETPAEWGLMYEDVYLSSRDGVRLHGWYIPRNKAEEVVLFLHGNGGNISHRGASIEIFNRIGLNILIIDYRGYGKSEGSPGEKGLYEDARTAWRYLIEQRGFKTEQIILFGRSLGAAVATKLATEVGPKTVILESAFSRSRDMADTMMPIVSRIAVMRYPFNSTERIKDIHARLLMLHSPDDEIIPYRLGEKLFQAANEPKQFVKLKGDHNNGFMLSQPKYEQALSKFINSKSDQ
jgi:fermentation-respiration switch protein FrsA (DUF1100 family)